jgi:hypothetical protein
MASTFSPSLRLELIGDGDQSGIWGQTTNNNLGALVEQAITGVVNISMIDANYTLTNFNGVTDEARNAVLVFTGTLSTTRNIIAPLTEKTYTIVNNTTGGFAIQIIGSSGTGVSIPNGMSTQVYCNGTNYVALQNGVPGNFTANGNMSVIGNATITGNLTVNGTSNIIPTGTRLPFAQAAAPTGFTQVTDDTANNRMLRVVNSSGGGTGGSASPILMNVVPNHTHTFSGATGGMNTNQAHAHSVSDPGHNHQGGGGGGTPGGFGGWFSSANVTIPLVVSTASTGISINATNIDHLHGFSGTTNSNAGSDWAPRYIDMIICAKN